MTDVVQTEDRGAVRIVAINRPEARNAINTTVLIELRKAVREAAKAEALRALVITGRGGAFSAGADVKEWADLNRGINPASRPRLGRGGLPARPGRVALSQADGGHDRRRRGRRRARHGAGLRFPLRLDARQVHLRLYPRRLSARLRRLLAAAAAHRHRGRQALRLHRRSLGWRQSEIRRHGDRARRTEKLEEVTLAFAAEARRRPDRRQWPHQAADRFGPSARPRRAAGRGAAPGKLCLATADHQEGLAAANERRTPNFVGR